MAELPSRAIFIATTLEIAVAFLLCEGHVRCLSGLACHYGRAELVRLYLAPRVDPPPSGLPSRCTDLDFNAQASVLHGRGDVRQQTRGVRRLRRARDASRYVKDEH